jgi:hypothetical protein
MSKKSFVPDKPILVPLPNENLVSYGDRLLWHQLGLQINGHARAMLTEDEYVRTVCGFFQDAIEENVRAYRSYFNSKQETMGFRAIEMPVPVHFMDGGMSFDERKRPQDEVLAEVRGLGFSAGDRLTRDEVHERKRRT